MIATDSFESVVALLKTMQSDLAGTLSAYEVMWNDYFSSVTNQGGHRAPMARDYPFYVLAEAEGADTEGDETRFQKLLENALENEVIIDAVLPKNQTERDALWVIREEFDPVLPAYLYDISLPIKSMSAYVKKLKAALQTWRTDTECVVFGHIADGNLHIFVSPFEDGIHHDKCDEIIYGCLEGFNGSISAEHGIGTEKKRWLGKSRSVEEIKLMQGLKQLLDPKSLLNPRSVIN